MSLYQVRWDGGEAYVEAETFGECVKVWRAAMIATFGGPPEVTGWGMDSEPESVTLLTDDDVIRMPEAVK